jgi:hypothetical protein
MSRFIHIAEKTPPWLPVLRGACVVAAMLGVAWYALSDEGLPIAPPGGNGTPFVKATPLPAPPSVQTRADDTSDDDAPPTGATHGDTAHASSRPGTDSTDDDYLTRNAGIDTHRLSFARPVTARTFLSEVLVTPTAQAGFVVAEVMPESRYERMGLRPGDVIYTLDTPGTPGVDESSMVALMQQTELQLEVYRNGTLTRLHTNLATLENGDALPR